jgi:hypothetical protein
MVSNRDIGFVFAGQDAEIKVDAFNFTRAAGTKSCEKHRNTPMEPAPQSNTAPFYRSRIAIEGVSSATCRRISMSRRACRSRPTSGWAGTILNYLLLRVLAVASEGMRIVRCAKN